MINWRIAFWRGDFFCGAALGLLGLAFALGAARMPFNDDGAPGPGLAPFLLAIALAGLGGFCAVRAVIDGKSEQVEGVDRELALVLGLLIAAIILFEPLGFLITTFFYLLASFTLVGREPLLRAGAVAFISTVVLWWFFEKALGVSLPKGVFPLV